MIEDARRFFVRTRPLIARFKGTPLGEISRLLLGTLEDALSSASVLDEALIKANEEVERLKAEARIAAEREEFIIRCAGGHICRSCGKEAERNRWGPIPYAIPTCYACLPPPPPLKVWDPSATSADSSFAEIMKEERQRSYQMMGLPPSAFIPPPAVRERTDYEGCTWVGWNPNDRLIVTKEGYGNIAIAEFESGILNMWSPHLPEAEEVDVLHDEAPGNFDTKAREVFESRGGVIPAGK